MKAKIRRHSLSSFWRTTLLFGFVLLLSLLSEGALLAQALFTITTSSPLPNGMTGSFYSIAFSATGSTAIPFTWSIISGTVPPGLALSSGGVLSGTPTTAGIYNFTVQVADATGLFTSSAFSMTVTTFTITTTSPLSFGAVGAFYSVTFAASGSIFTPYTWSLVPGVGTGVPPGVTLFGGGGMSGTPTSPGTYTFRVQAADNQDIPQIVTKDFSLTVIPLTVTTLAPASIVRGNQALTLVVNGTGFVPFNIECAGSTVRWNGTNLTTTFLSSSSLQAIVTGDLVAQAGSATVDVLNLNNCGPNATSNPVVFNIYNPTAAITSIDPTNANPGSPAFTLTVFGTNFVQNAVVRWNGADLTTTFVKNGELTALVPGADLINPGRASITVFNPLSAGDSNAVSFTVNNPLPTLTALSPQSIQSGSRVFILTVTGTNFVNGSSVLWNGNPRDTTFVSSTQLTAVIPASDVAVPGTFAVSVSNPSPGGGTSNTVNFSVAGVLPNISALSPQSIQVGSPAFPLTVTGSNYVNGSIVLWNGSNRTTTFVSSTQLTAQILAADVATAGSASVSVSNPGPNGGASNVISFTINPAPVVITTAGALTDGFVGVAYSGPLAAQGGVPPYAWSISGGALPGGVTLNGSTGLISGTPSASGSFAFTVQVLDGLQQTASKPFSLTINPLPSTFTITGVSDTAPPGQQLNAGISLSSPYTLLISGTLVLTITADVDDPAIQFATGGRSVDFTIPVGATQAVFPGNANQIGFQTGTVVSTIKLSINAVASGQALPLNPDPTRNLTVEKTPPVITSVAFGSQSSSGFNVLVTGFASARSVTQATFDFSPKPGANFQQTSITVNAGSQFDAWFASQGSLAFGSEFLLTVPFTVSGDVSTIGSVTVRLTNGDGTSDPKSASP